MIVRMTEVMPPWALPHCTNKLGSIASAAALEILNIRECRHFLFSKCVSSSHMRQNLIDIIAQYTETKSFTFIDRLNSFEELSSHQQNTMLKTVAVQRAINATALYVDQFSKLNTSTLTDHTGEHPLEGLETLQLEYLQVGA